MSYAYHEYHIFKDYSQSTPILKDLGKTFLLHMQQFSTIHLPSGFLDQCYIKLSKVNELYSHYFISFG